MEPQRLTGGPVYTDDHRGRYTGCLQEPVALQDQLTVTGEHDCFGRIRRDVHRDLRTTLVLEPLGHDRARDRVGEPWFQPFLGTACADGQLVHS
jgi:hypothetical protein